MAHAPTAVGARKVRVLASCAGFEGASTNTSDAEADAKKTASMHVCPVLMGNQVKKFRHELWRPSKELKKGEPKTRAEFRPAEATFPELCQLTKGHFDLWRLHKDRARVIDKVVRPFKERVPPHCVCDQQDCSENGSHEPKIEWTSRHWQGGEQYTCTAS